MLRTVLHMAEVVIFLLEVSDRRYLSSWTKKQALTVT